MHTRTLDPGRSFRRFILAAVLVAAAVPHAQTPAPDPTLLPQASTTQKPNASAYGALNVPGLAAGASYTEPTSGVRVVKLTSNTFPAAGNWWHDYSEGGDEVSLPQADGTRYVLARGTGGYKILTVNLATSPATLTSRTLAPQPNSDVCFAFSNNPATPFYAFVWTGVQVVRVDVRTMTGVPGDGWPVKGGGNWLHQAANDSLFVWMTDTAIVGYEPSTGTTKTTSKSGANEPRILRGTSKLIGLSMDTPANGGKIWNWATGAIDWTLPGDPGIPFAHQASLGDRWLGANGNTRYPFNWWQAIPGTQTAVDLAGAANGDLDYCNGNWVQPAGPNAWALCATYGRMPDLSIPWLAPTGMVYVQPSGGRRLLGFPYNTLANTTSTYARLAFPKQSPDGGVVLFTSNMNGAARTDLFLAVLPGGTAPTPTPVDCAWSAWSAWGPVPGDPTREQRTRTSSGPFNGGAPCTGDAIEFRPVTATPVDCTFSSWSIASQAGASIVLTRTTSGPTNGGAACVGPTSITVTVK